MDFLRKHEKEIGAIIEMALKEDVGAGDITTEMIVPEAAEMKGVFIAKDPGVICGLTVAGRVFARLDRNIRITYKKKDGDKVKNGDIVAVVKGNARSILKAERVALNLLQRLSGIATAASRFVEITGRYGVTILDTRKTTPNLRVLEKYAVKAGGGENHRMGLYDAVLIKDNHLDFVDLEPAMRDLRRFLPHGIKMEIEIDNLELLEKAITAHPDIIMLDNMGHDAMEKAIARIKGAKSRIKIEVSGGVSLKNVGDIARLKPDYISVGSITHSPRALDISFKSVK
jgi:nicotinate-nucleotide pyrophosphorylase (carboxylating)